MTETNHAGEREKERDRDRGRENVTKRCDRATHIYERMQADLRDHSVRNKGCHSSRFAIARATQRETERQRERKSRYL